MNPVTIDKSQLGASDIPQTAPGNVWELQIVLKNGSSESNSVRVCGSFESLNIVMEQWVKYLDGDNSTDRLLVTGYKEGVTRSPVKILVATRDVMSMQIEHHYGACKSEGRWYQLVLEMVNGVSFVYYFDNENDAALVVQAWYVHRGSHGGNSQSLHSFESVAYSNDRSICQKTVDLEAIVAASYTNLN